MSLKNLAFKVIEQVIAEQGTASVADVERGLRAAGVPLDDNANIKQIIETLGFRVTGEWVQL